jgi:hypothetical protein
MIYNFEQFITETLQKSQSIIKSKMRDYENLKDFLTSKNSIGYLGKVTEFLFSGVPYDELVNLYNDIIDLKTKNIKFNLDSYDKYEDVLDDIAKKKIAYKFRYIYNQFPKEQKDLFNLESISDSDVLTISKIYDVDDYTPFIKKISRYKDKSDLIDAATLFLKSKLKSYSREYIKSLFDENIQLAFENENILIIKIKNFESIKKVGDDTSWCIVFSQSTFKNYTKEDRNQYVLFDYTKDQFEVDFKIGFTVSQGDKIIYAHDILDSPCIPYLKQVLLDNGVDIKNINEKVRIDTSKFNNQSGLTEIKNILNYDLTEEDTNRLLAILCFKDRRSSVNVNRARKLIIFLFKKIRDKKGEILEYSDIERYKTCFKTDNQFEEIKNELINKFILLSDTPPNNLFTNNYYKSDIIKNYKRWNVIIDDENFEKIIKILREDLDYLEIIKYYIEKTKRFTNKVKLLSEYCKFLSGEQINEDFVKGLIDIIVKKEKTNRYYYYDCFGFKYYFDEDEYKCMTPENIIPEKIKLVADWSLESKLSVLENCDVTVNMSEDYLLKKINDGYKVVGDNIHRRVSYNNKNYSGIFDILKDKLTSEGKIRKRIIFKLDTELPIVFRYTFKIWQYSKEVEVVIS